MTPADGAVVADTPAVVEVRFSEAVSLTGGSARVLDPARGRRVRRAAGRRSTITIPLGGQQPDGTYTVTWVAISEDSHPVSGATTFSIGAPSAGRARRVGAGGPGRAGACGPAPATLVAVAYAGALVAAVGAGGSSSSSARGEEGRWRRRVRSLAGRAAVLGAVAAVASMPLRIARVGGGLGALRDNDVLGESLRADRDLDGRHRGRAAGAGRVDRAARRGAGRSSPSVRSGSASSALAGFAVEGHTRSQHPVALMFAFDVVHLAAGAVWLGGIAALVVAFRGEPDAASLGRVVQRFSAMAVGAVAVVVAAGTGMAIIVLPTFGDLFSTGYGLALLVKVAIVGRVIVLGAVQQPPPRAGDEGGAGGGRRRASAGRLAGSSSVELVGCWPSSAVTSVLVNRSPIASPRRPRRP